MDPVQLEFDLQTYGDGDYAHKAENRGPVYGVAVNCGVHWCLGCLGRQTCETPPTMKAEYVPIAERAKEALYVRGTLTLRAPSVEVDDHYRVRGQQGVE